MISGEASDVSSELNTVRSPDCRTAADPLAIDSFDCTGDSERGLLVIGETDSSLRCAMLRLEMLGQRRVSSTATSIPLPLQPGTTSQPTSSQPDFSSSYDLNESS